MLAKDFDLTKAWDFVKNETLCNKPTNAPYPQSIVKAREILLAAQTLLGEYETETSSLKRVMIVKAFNHKVQQYRKIKGVNN